MINQIILFVVSVLGTLSIPSIGLLTDIYYVPIVDNEWDMTVLGDEVGYLEGTAWIDTESYNMVLSGHSTGKFGAIYDMAVGDKIYVYDAQYKATYEVTNIYITDWTDTTPVQNPIDNIPRITLITCYSDQRYVVQGERVSLTATGQ